MMKASAIVVALLVMFFDTGRAQSGCTTALMSLTPCLNYVTGSSATPSTSCCSQLGNVISSNPRCLCALLNGGGSSLGISINQTLALALPAKCKVQTPPVSQCNSVAEVPAAGPSSATSPVSSPIPDEPKAPTTTDVPPIRSGITDSPASGPSSTGSPITSDEPETPTSIVPVPPIYAGTTSKTVPATKDNTSRGTITMGSSSFTISMLAIFLFAFSSIVN